MVKKWHKILKDTPLFDNMEENNIDTILQCIDGKIKNLQKGEFILLAGDIANQVGIVLSGELHIISECFDGKRSITSSLGPKNMYGVALYCSPAEKSPVSVMAKTDSVILQLDFASVFHPCPNTCGLREKLIENMLNIVAMKNIHLQNRIKILSINSVRGRVLHYLESFVPTQGQQITIPFNREEMANFLCVERSALSHELAKMKREHLIDYKKNRFYLKSYNSP